MKPYDRSPLIKDQLSGVVVHTINELRIQDQLTNIATQDIAFRTAIAQVDQVRTFLGRPENILGSELTKHGEIAEHVEVGIRNARAALHQQNLTATFENVGRTAPEDYLIDGVAVQSKFINGVNNNLTHVLNHMEKYSNFGRDGSYYHIPQDTHATIIKVMAGDDCGLAKSTVNAIREKVHVIEQQSGQAFNDVVKPGVSNYAEVQQGKVLTTLDHHESHLKQENERIKEQISQNHQPSLQGAINAAALAGVVGGTLSLATAIYGKYKQGKNPFKGDFSANDWNDVGIDTAKGAGIGAIAGGSIYLLTNYASMSAPFAAAIVSASKGVGLLVNQLNAGAINFDQFIDLGMIVCAESAIVGVATAAGQMLIPVPLIGAVIGSLAGRILAEVATGKSTEIAKRLQRDMDVFLKALDEKLQHVFRVIESEFDRLGQLTVAAFDLANNCALLRSSVVLAQAHGVPSEKIITTHCQLDEFMLL
ncbi:hypothetical protein [Chromatium okenii]|uniref:hypothetical protein n=1 Tax=Chromatium okenii TaxID=61644 RepID=UPI0026EE269C|nr:hypothetical protein [Chromatium okenii]MBV5309021.1 hypothetical protein [Chromatium okenii]